MSILVIGASHRTANVELLERLALDGEGAAKLRAAALDTPHVVEALVLATCNRVEIYAAVDRFHGGVDDLTTLLVDRVGWPPESVIPSLYVHYDEGAVAHLFSVATGLDSMVVGESQVLGQVREVLRQAQTDDTIGPVLNSLFQQGLRVGKRAHAETGIDRTGQSVVSVALTEASSHLGGLESARVVIVGAGSIAGLAAASVRRRGIGEVVVASRTRANAERVAARVDGRAVDLADLPAELTDADVLLSCTGATGVVVPRAVVSASMRGRGPERPLVVIDLALPHDVDRSVTDVPGVVLIGLAQVADSVHNGEALEDVAAVRLIVAEEVAAFETARDAARVAPTVVALRTMATGVVAAELGRLFGRIEGLSDEQQAEITLTVHRVADKLLHEPTVRIKTLGDRMPSSTYAAALVELFALDQASVEAVTQAGETE
ncbi:MAG: glutamyl-tRNA reductase [Nocardioidaceae bacterium]